MNYNQTLLQNYCSKVFEIEYCLNLLDANDKLQLSFNCHQKLNITYLLIAVKIHLPFNNNGMTINWPQI